MAEETKVYETRLAKVNNTYLGMIESQLKTHEIKLSGYGKNCVINAIAAINELLSAQGLDFSSPELDSSTLTTALLSEIGRAHV